MICINWCNKRLFPHVFFHRRKKWSTPYSPQIRPDLNLCTYCSIYCLLNCSAMGWSWEVKGCHDIFVLNSGDVRSLYNKLSRILSHLSYQSYNASSNSFLRVVFIAVECQKYWIYDCPDFALYDWQILSTLSKSDTFKTASSLLFFFTKLLQEKHKHASGERPNPLL